MWWTCRQVSYGYDAVRSSRPPTSSSWLHAPTECSAQQSNCSSTNWGKQRGAMSAICRAKWVDWHAAGQHGYLYHKTRRWLVIAIAIVFGCFQKTFWSWTMHSCDHKLYSTFIYTFACRLLCPLMLTVCSVWCADLLHVYLALQFIHCSHDNFAG